MERFNSLFSGVKFTAVGTSFVLVAFPLTQTVTQTRKRAESSGEDTGSERSGKAGRKRDKRRQNGLTNSTTTAHNPEVVGSNPSPATISSVRNGFMFRTLDFFYKGIFVSHYVRSGLKACSFWFRR